MMKKTFSGVAASVTALAIVWMVIFASPAFVGAEEAGNLTDSTEVQSSPTITHICPDYIGFAQAHMHLSEIIPGKEHRGPSAKGRLSVPVVMGESRDCRDIQFKITAERLDPQNEPDILDDIQPIGAGATHTGLLRGGYSKRTTSGIGNVGYTQVPGETQYNLIVDARKEAGDYGLREGAETFRLRLHSVSAKSIIDRDPDARLDSGTHNKTQVHPDHATMLVTIRDAWPYTSYDSGQLCPEYVGFEDSVVYVEEGQSVKTDIMTGHNRVCNNMTVHYKSIDGEYRDTSARAHWSENDYDGIRGTVVLNQSGWSADYSKLTAGDVGDVRKSITVNAKRDNKWNEGEEYYYVDITGVEHRGAKFQRDQSVRLPSVKIDPTRSRLKVIIVDKDGTRDENPNPRLEPVIGFEPSLHSSEVAVPEGDSQVFRVRAFRDHCHEFSVDYVVTNYGTEAHHHEDHQDYKYKTGTLTFKGKDGDHYLYADITAQTLKDRIKEDNERFRVVLHNPKNRYDPNKDGIVSYSDQDCQPRLDKSRSVAIGRIIDSGKGKKEGEYAKSATVTVEGGWVDDVGNTRNHQQNIRFKFTLPYPIKNKVTIDYELLDRHNEASWDAKEGRDFYEEPKTEIVFHPGEYGTKIAQARVTRRTSQMRDRVQSLYLKVLWTTSNVKVDRDRVFGVIYPVGWTKEKSWEYDPKVGPPQVEETDQTDQTDTPTDPPVVTPPQEETQTPPPVSVPVVPEKDWGESVIYWGVSEIRVKEGESVQVPVRSKSDNGAHESIRLTVHMDTLVAIEDSADVKKGEPTGKEDLYLKTDSGVLAEDRHVYEWHEYVDEIRVERMGKGETEVNFKVVAVRDYVEEETEVANLCFHHRQQIGSIGNLEVEGDLCVKVIIEDDGESGYLLSQELLKDGQPVTGLTSGVEITSGDWGQRRTQLNEGDEPFTLVARYSLDRPAEEDVELVVDATLIGGGSAISLSPEWKSGKYKYPSVPARNGTFARVTIPEGSTHVDTPVINVTGDSSTTDWGTVDPLSFNAIFLVWDVPGVNIMDRRYSSAGQTEDRVFEFGDDDSKKIAMLFQIVDDDMGSRVEGPETVVTNDEGNKARVNFTRSENTSKALSIPYRVKPGTALEGIDYRVGEQDESGNHGNLEFGAGETEAKISIHLIRDIFSENNEQFTIELQPVSGVTFNTREYTVRIRDAGVSERDVTISLGTPELVQEGRVLRVPVYALLDNSDESGKSRFEVGFTPHGWGGWDNANRARMKEENRVQILLGYIFMKNQE